jgi:uracil-DNA glycosylase family 4
MTTSPHCASIDPRVREWWQETIRCRFCPTMAPWRKFPVESHGTAHSGIMILGEAPGRISLDSGRAFSNPRNQTIRRAFARALEPGTTATLEDVVYISDTVKCWPASSSGANRSPNAAETRACIERHLRREIELVGPRVVFAFGRLAARAARALDQFTVLAHHKRRRSLDIMRVIPLPHPSTRNIAGMKRAGIESLADYETRLAQLFRRELTLMRHGKEA